MSFTPRVIVNNGGINNESARFDRRTRPLAHQSDDGQRELFENGLYIPVGDSDVPSFFAKADELLVKTSAVSGSAVPASWHVTIEELCTVFESSSAQMCYLSTQSDRSLTDDLLRDLTEEEKRAFRQELKAVRYKGYSHVGCSKSLGCLSSLAVPVFVESRVVGAAGIFLPRLLISVISIEDDLLPQLRELANAIADGPPGSF